jgi:sec-independent protein translocase protein TatA
MRLGPLGLTELLIIVLVIAMIFNAKRLPEIGSSLGRSFRSFKNGFSGGETGDQETRNKPSNRSSGTGAGDDVT